MEESVNLLSADPRTGFPITFRVAFKLTNRGIYRIFGLRPGRYKVSVGQESVYRGVGSGRHSLSTTFHPDTNEAAKAGVIEISEGSEATSMDITVGRAREGFARERTSRRGRDRQACIECGDQSLKDHDN